MGTYCFTLAEEGGLGVKQHFGGKFSHLGEFFRENLLGKICFCSAQKKKNPW
jgi:hypothetical protein